MWTSRRHAGPLRKARKAIAESLDVKKGWHKVTHRRCAARKQASLLLWKKRNAI